MRNDKGVILQQCKSKRTINKLVNGAARKVKADIFLYHFKVTNCDLRFCHSSFIN